MVLGMCQRAYVSRTFFQYTLAPFQSRRRFGWNLEGGEGGVGSADMGRARFQTQLPAFCNNQEKVTKVQILKSEHNKHMKTKFMLSNMKN